MNKQKTLIVVLSILCLLLLVTTVVFGYMYMKEKEDVSTPPTNTNNQEKVLDGGDFEVNLFKEGYLASNQNSISNTVISPLSVKMAMAMVTEGASGDTLTQLREVLQLNENSKEYYKSMLDDILKQDDITLNIANSIWSREGLQFKSDFLNILDRYFRADAKTLDFNNPSSVDVINNWVDNKTEGKINRILDRIDPLEKMFLINAIYFNANWSEQFNEEMTQEKDFTLKDGSKVKTDLMSMDSDFQYQENDEFQAVELPYGKDGRFVMRVYLPKESKSIDDFVNVLTREKLDQWSESFSEKEGYLELPKFKTEYEKSLKDILIKLGIIEAFDPNLANFINIIDKDVIKDNLYISQVRHKTYIDVSEKGTEAAAVTMVAVDIVGSLPVKPVEKFEMIVDRPFFFTIDDTKLNEILFMGTILDPLE